MKLMLTNPYHLDQSIYVLRVVGWYFSFVFIQILVEHCKQTVEILINQTSMSLDPHQN